MIKPETIESLKRYAQDGVPTGDFLRAVLANDLTTAALSADEDNLAAMGEIAAYCYYSLPFSSMGSYKKVDAWTAEKRKDRAKEN